MDVVGWGVLGVVVAALVLLAAALVVAAVRRHDAGARPPGVGIRVAPPRRARDPRPPEDVPPADERLCHADEVDPDCGTRRHDRH
jgi:hypothetical protein